MSNLKKFPSDVLDILSLREWDRFKITLTFDHRSPVSSLLSPSERLCQISRNSLKTFLRYCFHKNGMDGRTTWHHNASGHSNRWCGGIKPTSLQGPIISYNSENTKSRVENKTECRIAIWGKLVCFWPWILFYHVYVSKWLMETTVFKTGPVLSTGEAGFNVIPMGNCALSL